MLLLLNEYTVYRHRKALFAQQETVDSDFNLRGASDVRVLAIIACLSVCHTPVLYQNG